MALTVLFPLPDDGPPQITLAGNPIPMYAEEPGAVGSYSTFRIDLLLEQWDGAAWREIVTLVSPGQLNGAIWADLSAYVAGAWTEDDFEIPATTDWDLTVMRLFRATVTGYGDGVFIDDASQTFYAIPGSSGESFRKANGTFQTLQADWVWPSRFLSHAPLTKQSTQFAQEFLYLPRFAALNMVLHYVAEYTDGTESAELTQPAVTGTGLEPAEQYMLRFSVGYAALGLGSLPKTVKAWRVWVTDELFPATEVRRYEIDCYENAEFGRYFLFRNSFGVWDTAYLTGQQRTRQRITSELVQKQFLPHFPDQFGRRFFRVNTRFQREAEVASGYLMPGHGLWLTDMAASGAVFLRNEGDREALSQYRPVTVVDASIEYAEDGRDLDFITLAYQDQTAHPGL